MSGVSDLSSRDVDLLKLSWRILSLDKTMTGYKFIMRLFQRFPSSQDKFPKLKGAAIDDLYYNGTLTASNKPVVVHGLMIMYRLESYIDCLDDSTWLTELVNKLGIEHIPRNITMREFALVAPIIHDLLDGLVQGSPSFLPGMKLAWSKLMGDVVAIFASAQAAGR